jgi:hypothetical protein
MRLHNESMPNILIRDVPEELHATLQRRAARSGQSLQQYLIGQLREVADRPSLQEVLARIEARGGTGRIGFAQAVADLAEDRNR